MHFVHGFSLFEPHWHRLRASRQPPRSAPATCAPRRRNTRPPAAVRHRRRTIIGFTSTATTPRSTPTAMPCSPATSRSARTSAASPPIRSPTTRRPARSRSTGRWTSRIRSCGVQERLGHLRRAGRRRISTRPTFQLFDRNGRGFAKDIAVQPDGKVELSKVRYTTCPVGNQDWMLAGLLAQSRHRGPAGRRAPSDHAVQGRAHLLHPVYLVPAGR